MTEGAAEVRRFVARCRRRLWWQDALPALHRVLWWATLAAGLGLAGALWGGAPTATPLVLAGAALSLGIAPLLRGGPGLVDAARRVDRITAGKSLLTTGMELAISTGTLPPVRRLVLGRAEARVRRLSPSSIVPLGSPLRLLPPAACLAALLTLSAAAALNDPVPADRLISLPVPAQAYREATGRRPASQPVGSAPTTPKAERPAAAVPETSGQGGGQRPPPAATVEAVQAPEGGPAFSQGSGMIGFERDEGDAPGRGLGVKPRPAPRERAPSDPSADVLVIDVPVAGSADRPGPSPPGDDRPLDGPDEAAGQLPPVPAAARLDATDLAVLTPAERDYVGRYFARLGEKP